MNIYEAMREGYEITISCGDKRMVWESGEWVVYERKPRAKTTHKVYSGDSADAAVAALITEVS